MKRGKLAGGAAVIAVLCLIGLFVALVHDKQIDVLNPSGQVADAQRNILVFTVLLSSLVVIPVFVLLLFFSLKYRAGNKKATYQPEWGENKWLETLWWGIPIVIIAVLGVVTWQTSHELDPYKQLAGERPLEVQVVALQWKWLFIYPEQQIATLNHMPAPVNRPIHFSLTADAPMSAFWIPALGSQIYAMNGMESQLNLKANKIGDYTGYTTNINGEGYADMKFTARIMSDREFSDWIADARGATERLDWQRYTQISVPKSETGRVTYRLDQPGLFEKIMNQNMSHGKNNQHMNHEMNHSTMEAHS